MLIRLIAFVAMAFVSSPFWGMLLVIFPPAGIAFVGWLFYEMVLKEESNNYQD